MGDFDQWDPNEHINLSAPKFSDLPVWSGAEAYETLDALSWSRLNRFVANPYFYKRNPEWSITSSGFELGSYIHTMLLEPEKGTELYERFQPPINEKTGKAYRSGKKYDEALEEFLSCGKRVYTDQMELVLNEIQLSLSEYGINDLKNCHYEVPIIGEYKGTKLKGRIDAYSEEFGIIDLKTTSTKLFSSSGRDSFYWSCNEYGYIGELTYFAMIVEQTTGLFPPCRIVAVQTTPPYQVGVYVLSENQLESTKRIIEDKYIPMWQEYKQGNIMTDKHVVYFE